ncbi:MAG: 3-phosphoshikimate 1-carboxyvinyltransferase [Aquaticitalea sp.]
MNLTLHKSVIANQQSTIRITGSKSESNRLLLLQALYPHMEVENVSNSDDSSVMQKALKSEEAIIDIHHAGTAMRFLTAYFAMQEGREVILTGSTRMKERPIKVLVDALNSLGADITYLETEGCPPLQIKGKALSKSEVTLKANVSSQYISALSLIAPKLRNGLKITLDGEITSIPYINMTLALLNEIGVETSFEENIITVHRQPAIDNQQVTIESDWSSASYYYSIVALSEVGTQITLSSYKKYSLQADFIASEIYTNFGVQTAFKEHSITLTKVSRHADAHIYNLNNSPDIAQTIAVSCFGLGEGCYLTGLHTLKIKETDRLLALKIEIEKLGGKVDITNDSLTLHPSNSILPNISISTYNDHRMAMAFAPLALKAPLQIEDAMVVSKSYPTFWDDLKFVGFKLSQ